MIEIFGKDNCAACKNAVKLCENLDQEFTYKTINVDEGADLKDLMDRALPEVPRQAPLIFKDDEFVGGFNELYRAI